MGGRGGGLTSYAGTPILAWEVPSFGCGVPPFPLPASKSVLAWPGSALYASLSSAVNQRHVREWYPHVIYVVPSFRTGGVPPFVGRLSPRRVSPLVREEPRSSLRGLVLSPFLVATVTVNTLGELAFSG